MIWICLESKGYLIIVVCQIRSSDEVGALAKPAAADEIPLRVSSILKKITFEKAPGA